MFAKFYALRSDLGRLTHAWRDERGAIMVIVALMLPAVLGAVALAAEYGNGLVIKAENQRIADLASYAGALAYMESESETDMDAAAERVAALNGVAAADVDAVLTTSPADVDQDAVHVTISTDSDLLLAPILGVDDLMSITSDAYTAFVAEEAMVGCIIALNAAQTGVTLSGGTSITANDCAVASNSTLTVPCGTSITSPLVSWDSVAPTVGCGGISGEVTEATTLDPLDGNTDVLAARTRLTTVGSQTAPTAPSVSGGTAISFAYSQAATIAAAAAAGCVATYASNTWTMTCLSGGTYTFGTVTTGGGITVNWNTSGSASTTYRINGSIANTGTAMTFGPGTYEISRGITTGGGTTTTFAAGTYRFGAPTSGTCNSSVGRTSICHQGTTLTFGGPSTFEFSSGIYVNGGSTLNMGSGTSNSYNIGPSTSNSHAVYLGGGSKTLFADALGTGKLFQLTGNLNGGGGGGSCLKLPAAAEHDIKGYFTAGGGISMGAGTYTIRDYMALGASGGGAVTCWSASLSVYGEGVTIVVGGTATPSSGSCATTAFCVAAGYSNVTLSAPTTGGLKDIVIIGPAANTAGATFAEGGSSGKFSGVFYFPNGPITMSGAAGASGGSTCLQLIGSRITLSGGSSLMSECDTSSSVETESYLSLVQ